MKIKKKKIKVKMKKEKITLNVYLRALFRDLIRDYEDLKKEMLKLKTNQETKII